MSVIGIDFGNDTCVIGMAARGGIDIILNENSNRKNPTLVSFQGKQRMMGEAAASVARSNYKNTVREVKRLIGRSWGSPELEADLKRFPFKTMEHPDSGGVGIELEYEDTTKIFTPEQIVACMLTKLVAIGKAANNGIDVADTVIGIPGWYTDAMRRSMMNSCAIAGVNCLRLMHEHTATALAYGIYRSAKGEFSDKEPEYVLFLDLGHSTFSASVATFVQGALIVKSAAFDRSLGGRDMDWAIMEHAAEEFKAKTGKDPREKPKSLLKLLDAAEKAKKQLSPVGVNDTPINIECLWEDLDYNGRLTLTQFESLIRPLVERMDAPVNKALAEAGITKDKLASVEIVGGGTRVPMVKGHLADLLGRDKSAINFGLSCTMNADESIARGCALQCAMLSSRFKVKEFSIVEIAPYPICLSWEGEGPGGDNMTNGDEEDDVSQSGGGGNSLRIFAKGDETPKVRRVNFNMSKEFTLTAAYDKDAELPAGSSDRIGTFKIEVPEGADSAKIRVNVKHDIHGTFNVQSAEMMKEVVKTEEPAPDKPVSEGKENNKAEGGSVPMEVDGEDAQGRKAASENGPRANEGAGEAAANGGADGGEGQTADKAEDGSKKESGPSKGEDAPPKKKAYSRVPLGVDPKTAAWSKSQIDEAVAEEAQMANQDRVLRETADKRNELESYVYSMRDKLAGSLRQYVEGNDAETLSNKLTAAEDWLYSDEGFDSTKSVYTSKLKDLTDLGGPVESRMYEANNRQDVAGELQRTVDNYIKFANSTDDAYAHINEEDKSKVRDAAKEAERWLFQKLDQQANLPPSKDPLVTCEDIRKQTLTVNTTCRPIMNKPKPAPKPAAKPAPAAKENADGAAGGQQTKNGASAGSNNAGDGSESAPPQGEGAAGEAGTKADMDAEAAPAAEPSKVDPAAASVEGATPSPMETDDVEELE